MGGGGIGIIFSLAMGVVGGKSPPPQDYRVTGGFSPPQAKGVNGVPPHFSGVIGGLPPPEETTGVPPTMPQHGEFRVILQRGALGVLHHAMGRH